ncbi:MAG TPA: tetratricopeptide repeat protein [Flavobacteriales bacterium]|nr:tetratricopeptide repeat protein [Flavobacteriales bacterium]
MKWLLVLICASLFHVHVNAQADPYMDSLFIELKKVKEDTNKVNVLNALAWNTGYYYPDSGIVYANKELALAKKLNWKKGMGRAWYNLANFYYRTGEYAAALEFSTTAEATFKKIGDARGLADVTSVISFIHRDHGDLPKALVYMFKALKMNEALKRTDAVARDYGNIANVYLNMNQCGKAKEYYLKSDALLAKTTDKFSQSISKVNLGSTYECLGNDQEAKKYYLEGIKLCEKINNTYSLAIIFGNMGNISRREGNRMEALAYFEKAIELDKLHANSRGLSIRYGYMAILFMEMKEYKKAEEYTVKAATLAKQVGAKNVLVEQYRRLAMIDSLKRDFKNAFANQKLYVKYRDSLMNEQNVRETAQAEMQDKFDREETARQAKREKEKALMAAERRHQQTIIWVVCFVLAGVLAFLVFIFQNLRTAKKQKQVIEVQTREMNLQKDIIEAKQKEILDSIHYAKRIQRSQLPTEKYIIKSLRIRQ